MIKAPYLLFIGNAPDLLAAKVANGIAQWRRDKVIGQWRFPECSIDLNVGDISIDDAIAKGAKTLVIGVANRGGVIDQSWLPILCEALEKGLDLACGLHQQLQSIDVLVEKAAKYGRSLHDVRVGRHDYPIAKGTSRKGKRVVMVGTDCSVGKMYTALALEMAFKKRGLSASFKATGQTGILIEGSGVPADAVISDFLAGSIEQLTPETDDNHWDFVEGQGSLCHPSFSGVTLGLLHGAMPTHMVMCHEPNREHMRGLPGRPLPKMDDAIKIFNTAASIVNPKAKVSAICVNSSSMDDAKAKDYLKMLEDMHDMPATDPVRFSLDKIVDLLIKNS